MHAGTSTSTTVVGPMPGLSPDRWNEHVVTSLSGEGKLVTKSPSFAINTSCDVEVTNFAKILFKSDICNELYTREERNDWQLSTGGNVKDVVDKEEVEP